MSQPHYGKSSYWDDRYTKDAEEIFDWYQVSFLQYCQLPVTMQLTSILRFQLLRSVSVPLVVPSEKIKTWKQD